MKRWLLTLIMICAIGGSVPTALGGQGWYLLLPPMTREVRSESGSFLSPDIKQPLRAWKVSAAFDSAKECEAAKRGLVAQETRRRRERSSEFEADPYLERETWADIKQAKEAQCVASDDARLVRGTGRWYLALAPWKPPQTQSAKDAAVIWGVLDYDAPFRTWEIRGSFDSAEECTSAKQEAEQEAHRTWVSWRDNEAIRQMALQDIQRAKAGACIASDDPRLR